jgi:hypothetical protein
MNTIIFYFILNFRLSGGYTLHDRTYASTSPVSSSQQVGSFEKEKKNQEDSYFPTTVPT